MTFIVKLTLMSEQSWNHAGKKMDDKKSQSEDEGTLAQPGGRLRKKTQIFYKKLKKNTLIMDLQIIYLMAVTPGSRELRSLKKTRIIQEKF